MATYNLGQVGIVNKGAWSSSTAYSPLNTVTHNSGSFMCIAANTNIEPGVTSGWATYWVSMAKGIKSVAVTAVDSSTAQMTVTFSDGTTATSGTFNTATVGVNSVSTASIQDGALTTDKYADGSITGAKLASTVLPANVGIKIGNKTTITTADISQGQIYLQYS